jgi:16S rRNA U1498 N3-methylase RsmE
VNYSDIIQAIARATSFDLYRLQSAIARLLDDPQRITEVRRRIHPGDDVEYFDASGNRVVQARLLKFQRTRVLVQNRDDQEEWSIPYCALNIHKAKTTITETVKAGLGRNQVSVGDTVGFCDRDGRERYGQVTRLNQKTVTLDCGGQKWRVAYSLLFSVIDLDVEPIIESRPELP